MSRLRYRAMYVTSCAVGYAVAGFLLASGIRFEPPGAAELVRQAARGHAEDAEHKVGPYLAPITFAVALLGMLAALGVFVWSLT